MLACNIINIIFIIIFIIYFYFGFNTISCIDQNLCLTNLSLTKNYFIPYSCNESHSINIPFHANRILRNNPNFIVVTIYLYHTEKKFFGYMDFVKLFAKSNTGKILLLVSFLIPLYNFFKSCNDITEIKSNYKILKHLHQLNERYSLFKFSNNESFCYIFYIKIEQHYFSKDFLKHTYHTMNYKKYPFSGYYAAGTNLYSVIPYMLKIFDYFDYYFKIDIDFKIHIPKIMNINEFSFGNYKNSKWFLFGTKFNADADFVCTNVKEMILGYAKSYNCTSNIISAIKLLTNECIQFVGYFTGMWLGLYSSIEMKQFSNFYINYKDGIRKYRWGDQQFFVNSILLFSGRDKMKYNLSYN